MTITRLTIGSTMLGALFFLQTPVSDRQQPLRPPLTLALTGDSIILLAVAAPSARCASAMVAGAKREVRDTLRRRASTHLYVVVLAMTFV